MVSTRNSVAGLGSTSTNDTALQYPAEPSAASSVDPNTANESSSQALTRSRKRRRTASPNNASAEPIQKRATLRKPSASSTNPAPANRNTSAYPGQAFAASAHASGRLANQVTSGSDTHPEGDGAILIGSHGLPQVDGHGDTSPSETGDDTVAPQLDMHAVINQIIDHGEHVESQYGVPDEGTAVVFTTSQLKIQSLPILENVAVQVLTIFANTSYDDLSMLTSEQDNSDASAAYSSLKFLFDATKKVYSITSPFLSPRELGFTQRAHIDTIRKANLATFMSSVFGSHDVSFHHLNEFFLDTFLAHGTRLLKTQAGLFLDLKTHAYISAITTSDRSRGDILEDLFPQDLEQRLLKRRSGAKQPSPGEADFVQRANNRKKALLEEPQTVDAKAQLADKYIWEDFLRDILSYTSKNSAYARNSKDTKKSDQFRSTNLFEMEQQQANQREHQGLSEDKSTKAAGASPPVTNPNNAQVAQIVPPDTDDIAEKAARAAEFAMQGFSVHQQPAGPLQQLSQDRSQQYSQQYPFHFEHQPAPYYTQNQYTNVQPLPPQSNQEQSQQPQSQQQNLDLTQQQTTYPDQGSVPYPTQSAPTSILYERARLAATAKASPSNRRAGHPSQRRPWTAEEENALMFGLDHVKGPHWSQILAMYGPGGTIDETLKDRNQVQLKDKARNLKLFFLKSGIEVPYYLQFVTGELKTRAPQAARLAAKEAAEAAAAAASNTNANGDQNANGTAAAELETDAPEVVGGVEEAVGGAEDHEAVGEADDQEHMEDGEGEMIDPAEYAAAVHAVGHRNMGTGQGGIGMQSSDAQQQLYEAAGG